MATTSNGIKIIYGGGGLSSILAAPEGYDSFHDYSKAILAILEKEGISTLDTAEIYPGSEEEIAYNKATERFTVDTKLPGGFGESRTKDQIIAGGKGNLERLQTKQVHILYFHAPDTKVPFEEQLEASNELYKAGAFKYLGLSNYTPAQVQEVYDISKAKGYPLPKFYQGNYSAVGRKSESELLPTLRKLGIAYNIYSPIAGGFLAKTRSQVEAGAGRFNSTHAVGQLYHGLYVKPTYLDALDKWEVIAKDADISKAELAYRWATYHSALKEGDGIIFGAKNEEQTKQTIAYIRAGPLDDKIAERVNELWKGVEAEAPIDNFHK
ncbi:aldehyde reductase [Microthyrium microscopicum]|uniref:Aldehyde reductase n=1 Tax=Microthyrium microscopicum TaxID=703497 RepID=A0A6A6UAT8_9PEZI|nr:aldehyde reductase [Microthyrium microscopicum]